ncbi:MAG: sporulation protein YqfD [Clostridiales bacterium]|nr:sporulation protein YqfD [Clostridiales bacterium]
MLTKLINWCIGSRDYFVPAGNEDRAARLLVSSGANFRSLKRKADGLHFSIPLPDCEPVEFIFKKQQIEIVRLHEHGLNKLIRRYRHRYGIPIGIGMFFAILGISGQFIWSINVVGNDLISSHEIIEKLDELGCGVGTYIPNIDFDKLHTDFLLSSQDFAWVAVNVRGTRATVEVRETTHSQLAPDEDTPYNLVASEDGIVKYIEVHRGEVVTEVGALVRKGELLASGVVDSIGQVRLVHARGKVLAEVKRNILIEVPLERQVKVETGNEFCEKSLKILGFSLKFFKNTGNLPIECDKIDMERNLRFFDTVEVPVSIHETVWREYEYVTETITEEEARAEAYRQLRSEYSAQIEGCELLSREISAGRDGDKYVIECRLGLLADIAVESEIYR